MTNPASRVVLDSSAILATILDEPGAEVVRPRLRGAWVSTVNWSEVLQKLAQANVNLDVAREIRGFSIGLVDFDERAAEEAAALWETTRTSGLSFADRACIVTASRLGLPVWTADKRWTTINGLPAEVVLIR